ncbi:hypothetical protein K9M78_01720 [Candidatus Bipolaricaulota bacterium]|nr:hypothetical protein [Candidatus Bipolaricaulota bacterium]
MEIVVVSNGYARNILLKSRGGANVRFKCCK